MKVHIDHTKLIDSPYDGNNQSLFEFSSTDTEDFVNDIIYGNPTCYLISGYRGAGKSSFIKKLELEVKLKQSKALFVYLNFAKYEDRTIVLRKLIRNLYLTAEQNDFFKNINSQNLEKLKQFKELYERTFFEVSKNTNEKKEDEVSSNFKFKGSVQDLISFIANSMIVVAILQGFNPSNWYSWLLSAISFLGIGRLLNYEFKKTKTTTKSSELAKSSLYDDEIAEHYLMEILDEFKDEFKTVFVLDELDKIKDNELAENLINELKPLMLSGLSSFIIVAGQQLFYNYYSSQSADDGHLSSIFSKIHHIKLFSASELRILFKKLIFFNESDFSEEEKLILQSYVNYLIFESKRIPRRFVVMIRQNVTWEDKKAYLEIDKSLLELSIYSKILSRIEVIEDQTIVSENYQPPIQDYFSMQLFIKANYILKSKNQFFTENQIINYNG